MGPSDPKLTTTLVSIKLYDFVLDEVLKRLHELGSLVRQKVAENESKPRREQYHGDDWVTETDDFKEDDVIISWTRKNDYPACEVVSPHLQVHVSRTIVLIGTFCISLRMVTGSRTRRTFFRMALTCALSCPCIHQTNRTLKRICIRRYNFMIATLAIDLSADPFTLRCSLP